MSGWVGVDGRSFSSIEPGECARILHDLAERNLSIGAVRRVLDPASPRPKGDQPGLPWVSDAGFSSLFRQYELEVPTVSADIAMARLHE